ncbi:MAG: HAMP domain-containing sensor histidine kinase [Lachnospiraceae bacterium]
MSRQRKAIIFVLMFFLGLLLISLLTNFLLSAAYSKKQYETSAFFVNWFLEEYPDDEQKIMEYMKKFETADETNRHLIENNHLAAYGFDHSYFKKPYKSIAIASVILSMAILAAMFFIFFYFITLKNRNRIRMITNYLVKANSGKAVSILPDMEDDFSGLEDEIYKTITELRTAEETAIKERQNFADSLANIAHQIKTPVTALSVSIQMLGEKLTSEEKQKLKQQLDRTNQLISALLTVSKIDAGILELKKEEVDVFTALELAVEALESQIKKKEIEVILPNHPKISFTGDLDWSVELFINLIKNSMEHTAERGKICFAYEKNPLYVEISITDNGEGFDEKELPYLFNRFYQGGSKLQSGTGIGLSIAKSIAGMQNGFITAKNLSMGGACFSIRFYCH